MICDHLASLLGISCVPLTDDGNVAMIATPLQFEDGEALPVFVELTNSLVRFFDDGGVMMHFRARGLKLDDGRAHRFIRTAGDDHGVRLNERGEFEVLVPLERAPSAFARYVSALLQLTRWERDQEGVGAELEQFIEEVAFYLQAWKPHAQFLREPSFSGITGRQFKLDFLFDGVGVVATNLHHQAMSSTVRKLLDIRTSPHNAGAKLMAVIDDREEPEQAEKDGLVLQTVAQVLPFSRLVELAGGQSSMPN